MPIKFPFSRAASQAWQRHKDRTQKKRAFNYALSQTEALHDRIMDAIYRGDCLLEDGTRVNYRKTTQDGKANLRRHVEYLIQKHQRAAEGYETLKLPQEDIDEFLSYIEETGKILEGPEL